MKNDLSNVKVGDWIWTIRYGWEKVICIQGSKYRVVTRMISFMEDGREYDTDKYPSAFTEPPEGFKAEPKPCEFVKGQKVLVSDSEHTPPYLRAYFSHMRKEKHVCFKGGRTEWSSDGQTTSWKYCIPAVKEEE